MLQLKPFLFITLVIIIIIKFEKGMGLQENLERRERKRLYISQNHYINRTRQVRLSCVKPKSEKASHSRHFT